MRLSTVSAVLGGLVVSGAAISDLDASVWAKLDSAQPVKKSAFSRVANNRPSKRATWSPPSDLNTPLSEVWAHYEKTYDGGVFSNTNWGWDQIMANNGKLNICVRWDSKATVTAAQRTQIAKVYNQQYQKWFKWVYGFDEFPYSEVAVNIVGWAVKDKSLLEGSTDGIDVYTDLDANGIPMCAVGCARDAHLDGDYSACTGGVDHHYDHSLWLTDGLDGGYGYSWGQQIGREYLMNNIDSGNIHILLHEMGHTFGLDDFYDWTPTGVTNFIMLAGSAMEITDFDGWMFRNWWYKLAEKNSWGSSTSGSATSVGSASSTPATTPVTTPTQAVQKQELVQATTPVAVASKTPEPESESANPVSDDSEGEVVAQYAQCGGSFYSGSTKCASGLSCIKHNEFYSQCV